jgi:hypothetical protein
MKRVLVIDDHEPSRKILLDTLSQGGYQIAGEGATGKTAVALTTTTRPDVVLMAVGLPDAPLEMIRVNYRVTELHGWVIVTPTGKAENNEPLRVKYLFNAGSAKRRPRDCQSVHLWLENMTRIDLGNYSLRIFHRPGHTSGCISIIETTPRLLFSAYSVFAGGTLSYIAQSAGIIGDYIDSLTRVRYFGPRTLYSGHGRIRQRRWRTSIMQSPTHKKSQHQRWMEVPKFFTRSRMHISG